MTDYKIDFFFFNLFSKFVLKNLQFKSNVLPAPTQLKNQGAFNFCGTFLCYSENYQSAEVWFFFTEYKDRKICATEFKIEIKMSFIVPRAGKCDLDVEQPAILEF